MAAFLAEGVRSEAEITSLAAMRIIDGSVEDRSQTVVKEGEEPSYLNSAAALSPGKLFSTQFASLDSFTSPAKQ